MGTIYFSDGVNLKTDGPYRAVCLSDGWYCLGRGLSIPCNNIHEAQNLAVRFMVAALHRMDGDAVTMLCVALNSANWAEIDENGPTVAANPNNLGMFKRNKHMLPALRQYRAQLAVQRPDGVPLVDKIMAELEGK